MNITQAAGQIESALRAYTALTPEGRHRVSLAAQRPLYLIGPPGVGKTAAVAQAARRMGVGFAAYTMTLHTRQSALGLPVIARREVNGEERSVTEYTMSEIVAEVWARHDAGAERGILFLDEINCVSESLMPAMLQLLQYKTFGVHALPRDWMLVCAGNPPKYNRYAHTFDAVVLDRLRVIEVEPDLEAWRSFAAAHGVHPSVKSYLSLRPEDFYAADGDRVVTARSWTDLSDAMLAMEASGDEADGMLFTQYLQVEPVAERFTLYYRLCAELQARLDGMLEGRPVSMAGAPFDEALFAALLISGRLQAMAGERAGDQRLRDRLTRFAEGVAREAQGPGADVATVCETHIARQQAALDARVRMNAIDEAGVAAERRALSRMRLAAGEAGSRREQGPAAMLEALRACAPVMDDVPLERAFDRSMDFIESGVDDPNVRMMFLMDLARSPAFSQWLKGDRRARFDALRRASDPDERAGAMK